MKRLSWLLIVLGLLFACTLSAEKTNDTKALGMHFGTVSGNGYSYRYFKGDMGFQVTFGAYQIGDSTPDFRENVYIYNDGSSSITKSGKKTLGSFGVNGISVLTKSDISRFYLQFGASYLIDRTDRFTQEYTLESSGYYNEVPGARTKSIRNRDEWTIGIGPGLEMGGNKNLRFAFELPITYNQSKELIMYIPQVGLYYYFK